MSGASEPHEMKPLTLEPVRTQLPLSLPDAYINKYVCVCVYIYIYIHRSRDMEIYTVMHTWSLSLSIYIYIYMHIYTYIYTYAFIDCSGSAIVESFLIYYPRSKRLAPNRLCRVLHYSPNLCRHLCWQIFAVLTNLYQILVRTPSIIIPP